MRGRERGRGNWRRERGRERERGRGRGRDEWIDGLVDGHVYRGINRPSNTYVSKRNISKRTSDTATTSKSTLTFRTRRGSWFGFWAPWIKLRSYEIYIRKRIRS